jgi:alkanesulfonate monooxygenase SsuD/methylene tetrahydromethanopterin reductase-like flavin-dependent oxidoreductase (luciferase family)
VAVTRFGVTLPTFRSDLAALDRARDAEQAGLDGVFVFDHLWPMGRPDRPALAAFPVLGAVAAATRTVALGPLVARLGLVPPAVLVARFRTLAAVAPGRTIGGLGTGDVKSADEDRAYGVPARPAAERLQALRAVAAAVVAEGLAVWLGGRSEPVAKLARDVGAALNLWGAPAAEVARRARSGEVTWGGAVPGRLADALDTVGPLVEAGASWIVCAAPATVETVAAVAERLRS